MITNQILPLFRSETQARLLSLLYLHPGREYTVTELIETAGSHFNTVRREINALIDAGFLLARTSGRNRYLSANTGHPIFNPLAAILLQAYGPAALMSDALKDIVGLEEAWIFGSWARRYHGEAVARVNDVDVLLVGELARRDLFDTIDLLSQNLGIEVNFQPVTREHFEEGTDPFIVNVRESARVLVYRAPGVAYG